MATINGIASEYFEPPNSLLDMPDSIYHGLLAIGTFATISLIFTSVLLSFISWRMITWKSHYSRAVGRNQSIVLIYQMVLADFLQSLGFLISFHWAAERRIIGPNGACFAQGWLIQLGDVASAFFVLAIAIHTTYQVVMSRSVSYKTFLCCIFGIWGLAVVLTSLAPIIGGRFVFLRAGVWCWISTGNKGLRLSIHYIWIFIVEFGSIIVYATGFYYLYHAKRSDKVIIPARSAETMRKARTAMLAYAMVYTFLSLPLAAGRMAAMSNNELSDEYYLFAGALFTCSGWVDTLLYTFTRRALLFDELDVYGRRQTTRIEDGSHAKDAGFQRQSSTDSILASNGFGGTGGIKMETTVKVELDDFDSSMSNGGKAPRQYYATVEAFKP
ncbi:G protein-coupled glucose receptor regulating Gpa2-domain-containing protein [Daldinia caldariorum]|uniref:G protein-coupled glucose receptor regulating Gpa2-domain-containing protein n=1 Tax=Daldinia caldariorum TaxID=326644 RepID=UPI00200884F1|nr:G protein-coupled glucose receptor regulating Gpa2-domain-containing protein [Daldinia caldariorum]KAI1467573.1 G protein-coupled glucose receptor regulating Gpa2-domain-containing protein [Daldinia caldariorum]